MSKNGSSRGAPAPRKGSSLLAGILVGIVVGLAIAGGIAWYILKTPSPFVNNVQHEAPKLAAEPAKAAPAPVAKPAPAPVASAVPAEPAEGEGKPRFEFYKVLTDKQDAAVPAKKESAAEKKAAPAAQPAAPQAYYLQAGAFANPDDAEKLKAKLAMVGLEATVQAATFPDKTIWHRVRLGPYKSTDEMNKASAVLKQNGVNATPMRVQ